MQRERIWLTTPIERRTERNRILPITGSDGSTLNLDFTRGSLDSRLTFSRASTATFVNSSGYVDHAGANLLLYSAYANTNWLEYGGYSKSYTTGVTSPIGDATAARITFDAVGKGLYYNSVSLGSPNVVGATYTMSAWIRATASTTNANIRFGDSGVAIGGNIPITTTWTRYSLTYTNAISSSSPAIQSASGTPTGQFEMWGFQLNPGSTAQAYYPTTTAAFYSTPRFDYSPTNIGQINGLLIEGQTNNYLPYSNTFTDASWEKGVGNSGDVVITAPTPTTETAAPDGLNTATKITKPVGSGYGFVRKQGSSGTASGVRTASIWVKQPSTGAARYFGIRATGDGFAPPVGDLHATFDIQTGTVVSNTGTSYYTNVSITSYRNGWYRIRATSGSMTGTGVSYASFSIVRSSDGAESNSESGSLYIWGAQYEVGNSASSYIPTGASGVTRNGDICYMGGTNFLSWWNQSEGTAFIETVGMTNPTDLTYRAFTITQFNSLPYQIGATWIYDNSGFRITELASSATKHAVALKANDFAISNGSASIRTGTGAFSSTYNRLQLGSYESESAFMNGCIKRFKYYPRRLSNAQLQKLTKP